MKILLIIIVVIVVIIGAGFVGLSIHSRKPPELGLSNDRLRVCPNTPNCVCSEYSNDVAFVEPLIYRIPAEQAWNKIKQALVETGGVIVADKGDYLHASYETPIMRYVDDVELRNDKQEQRIHIRSASRVGHSDLGANRKRVERIRASFHSRRR